MVNQAKARVDAQQPHSDSRSSPDPATGRGPDPVAARRLARRTFQSGGRVDMQTIAAELGVDRTTLYRWVGNRDALLGDVLWSLGAPTWHKALGSMTANGARGVSQAMGRFVQALIDSVPLRTFLRAEPERALRLLTTKASVVQREMVASVEALIKQEQDRGNLTHPLARHDLAYLIVRIAESFIYNDLLTGERPDAAKAESAIAALLGSAPTPAPPGDSTSSSGPAPTASRTQNRPKTVA